MPPLLRQPIVQILLIAAGFALVLWIFWPKGVPRPDETNRIRHPAGFSVVVPPGFLTRIDNNPGGGFSAAINAVAEGWKGLPPAFSVRQFRSPPDVDELVQTRRYIPGQFLGRVAYAFNGPRGKLWHFRVVFDAGGRWFEISVELPDYVDVPNDKWFDYFKSFRVEGTTSTAPTTRG